MLQIEQDLTDAEIVELVDEASAVDIVQTENDVWDLEIASPDIVQLLITEAQSKEAIRILAAYIDEQTRLPIEAQLCMQRISSMITGAKIAKLISAKQSTVTRFLSSERETS